MDLAQNITEHTGFPNPATDKFIVSLSLDRLLIRHPSSTFFMRLQGNLWEDIGIFDGDIAVIDKAVLPLMSDIVIWWDIDEFNISKYNQIPEKITPWGVVTSIIHQCRNNSK